MFQFQISDYDSFDQIPLHELNRYNHSIYLLSPDWNYLFVNDFVKKNLGQGSNGILGKNMWEVFPELSQDAAFIQMKKSCEAGNM